MKTKGKSCRIVFWKSVELMVIIFFLVALFNIVLQTVLQFLIGGVSFISSFKTFLVLYGIMFSLIFIIPIAIIMAHNGTSILINFNIDRYTIKKEYLKMNIIIPTILAVLSFIGFYFLFNSPSVTFFDTNISLALNWSNPVILVSLLIIFVFIFLTLYTFCSFFTFVGMVKGWYYLVGTLFLFASFSILIKNFIAELILFGDNILVTILALAIFNIALLSANNKLISRIEYKY